MIFTTPEFVIFFLIFFSVFAALPGQARKCFLLLGSYAFYGSWNWKFCGLLLMSTVVDFFVAKQLHANTEQRRRRALLGVSLVVNLGVLAFFKYSNFFVESAAQLAQSLGWEGSAPVLDVVLPVGISFYTFQTLSYTIDVYRGSLKPATSFLNFATYVAMFPQLVAGPIERASRLLPQLDRFERPTSSAVASGAWLIAIGVFKKVVIADNLAPIVSAAYANPTETYSLALWAGTYAFAFQIYCDFSGYSDIAVGLGRLMGLDLMQNFKAPYAAAGPSEFWKRWHISLSTWLRDYLYIPLGGGRGGEWFIARNLALTMLLGGLWHGASWHFVLWGAYHGALLIICRTLPFRYLLEASERLPTAARGLVVLFRRFIFFHLVCIGWALFRARTLEDCEQIVFALLDFGTLDMTAWARAIKISGEGPTLALLAGLAIAILFIQNVYTKGTHDLVDWLRRWPPPLQFVMAVGLLYAAVVFAPRNAPAFIYFRF